MSDALARFVEEVRTIVRGESAEEVVTSKVAERLKELIKVPNLLRPEHRKLKEGGFVLWPVHIEEDGSFSIGIAAYGEGQISPIHDHCTWGVIGVYEGVEHEERFLRQEGVPLDQPATLIKHHEWDATQGEVFICCTTDADMHRVSCGSDVPVFGVHVSGNNIGAVERRIYNEKTGESKTYVGGWG